MIHGLNDCDNVWLNYVYYELKKLCYTCLKSYVCGWFYDVVCWIWWKCDVMATIYVCCMCICVWLMSTMSWNDDSIMLWLCWMWIESCGHNLDLDWMLNSELDICLDDWCGLVTVLDWLAQWMHWLTVLLIFWLGPFVFGWHELVPQLMSSMAMYVLQLAFVLMIEMTLLLYYAVALYCLEAVNEWCISFGCSLNICTKHGVMSFLKSFWNCYGKHGCIS